MYHYREVLIVLLFRWMQTPRGHSGSVSGGVESLPMILAKDWSRCGMTPESWLPSLCP